jgi:hypothetical protein
MAVQIDPNRNEIRPFQAFPPSSQLGLDPYLGTHGIDPDQVSVTHQDPLNPAQEEKRACFQIGTNERDLRVPIVGTLKRYFKALEYEYRVKTVVLCTLKQYSILSLTLYLEWYCAYSILYSGGPTS